MAYPASKKSGYWGQLGVLAAFTTAGLLIGGIVSLIPLLNKVNITSLKGLSSKELMNSLMVPENAGPLRMMQFITTLFLFFLPTLAYAWICHRKAFLHLGYRQKVRPSQFLVVVLIMIAILPFVNALGQLTEMLPFSKATMDMFHAVEEAYNKQVAIIGRMNNFQDYLVSLFMLAILPAMFEETLFRGGLQNLLSRWFKMPILSIFITALIFSFVHASYLGFLSRVALGFALGWMYYRTGNLWLSIIGHAANNTFAVTMMYVMHIRHPNMDISQADIPMPMWAGLISLAVVYGLFLLFEKLSAYQIFKPGQEVLIPPDPNTNPNWTQF